MIYKKNWPIDYIGQRWIAGENDCWSFCLKVWKEVFNTHVPPMDTFNIAASAKIFNKTNEINKWTRIEHPQEGCAVAMGKSKYITHVGIWHNIESGGVVHCVEYSGAVFSNLKSLFVHGWNILGFYTRGDNPKWPLV